MSNLIYRVVSVCGALGYGYPKESLDAATKDRIDAIISDAGSMDAGPYYLGTGTEYFERAAVKTDFRHMAEAGNRLGVPVILGSCGMAGGDRNVEFMLDVAKEVFEELGIRNAKVAVIGAELDPEIVIKEFRANALRTTGVGPQLDEDALRESTIVGQMGIHPLITALENGAQYIFAGRACDIALFASDMVRRGIDAGLAYHVGHVLECGALACDPGSPSDCLVAEVYDDGSARFVAPNPARRCTPYSIAAHSLYEESHPQLQFYPEGVLVMEHTNFTSCNARTTGIRGSRFVNAGKPWPLSIKMEGARRLGARKVSLIHIDPADAEKLPEDVFVYGRNGVQATPVAKGQRELGIIIETTSATEEGAVLLASVMTHYLIHYGYPGRKATAGNIAYPLSPNLVSFRRADGSYGAIVPSGTRDPVFFANYENIKKAVVGLVQEEFPDALKAATYRIIDADATAPAVLVRTIDRDPQALKTRHAAEIERITRLAKPKPGSLIGLDAPDAYEWTLYHLMQNENVIRDTMFPITYYDATGAKWVKTGTGRPVYTDIGEHGYKGSLDDRALSLIEEMPVDGRLAGEHPLLDMAVVIRSKDAGINRLTFDILFNSGENYEAALRSNAFTRASIARILGMPVEQVVGTFYVDTCNAIKISVDRPNISASPDEHDVFGAQQQNAIERLMVPMYARALATAALI